MENGTTNPTHANNASPTTPQTIEPEKPKTNNKLNKKILLVLLILLLIITPILVFSLFKFASSSQNKQSSVENINQKQRITPEEKRTTDLSSIQVVVDEDVTVSLKDSLGNEIGKQHMENPLEHPETGELSGDPVNIFSLDDPDTENYILTLTPTSGQEFQMDIYFYDRDAEVKIENRKLTGESTFKVYFDKKDSNNSYIE